jgi:hypothetical protein
MWFSHGRANIHRSSQLQPQCVSPSWWKYTCEFPPVVTTFGCHCNEHQKKSQNKRCPELCLTIKALRSLHWEGCCCCCCCCFPCNLLYTTYEWHQAHFLESQERSFFMPIAHSVSQESFVPCFSFHRNVMYLMGWCICFGSLALDDSLLFLLKLCLNVLYCPRARTPTHLQIHILQTWNHFCLSQTILECSCNLLDTLDLHTAQFDVIVTESSRKGLQECFGVTKRPRDLGGGENFPYLWFTDLSFHKAGLRDGLLDSQTFLCHSHSTSPHSSLHTNQSLHTFQSNSSLPSHSVAAY